MDRARGIVRNIRRQWSPYRVFSQIYNDNFFAEDPALRTVTTIQALDRLYFWLDDPITTEADTQFDSVFLGASDYETRRMYALYEDPDRRDATGNRVWNGSTLCVQSWALSSLYLATTVHGVDVGPYHESYVLTGGKATAQTLLAEYQLDGSNMALNQQALQRPWLNGAGVVLGTVVAATGTWAGATDLRVTISDRVGAEPNEFVVDVWRGLGGERIRHPVSAT